MKKSRNILSKIVERYLNYRLLVLHWLQVMHFKNRFWIGYLLILYLLKMITVISKLLIFVSVTHKYVNSTFSAWIRFSTGVALFQDFLPNQTNIAWIFLWFLETQGSTIDFIHGLLLLSKTLQDSIYKRVSKLFLLP